MPCYRPLHGWRSRERTENGKRGVTFKRENGFEDMPITVPCGRCIGCRLEYSRQWATRIMHEASLYEDNSFVTLTYADENLPFYNTLVKKHVQDFWKRMRSSLDGQRIRYYVAGEYSDEGRPHYHACIFNYWPSDANLYAVDNGYRLYESEWLDEKWGHGLTKTGSLTFESAAYVARYITKKINGKKAEEINEITGLRHYERLTDDGEIIELAPEYAAMSLKPGIGKEWSEEFNAETFRDDYVIVNGRRAVPPRYYFDQLSDKEKEKISRIRTKAAKESESERTLGRLRVRETVKKAQIRTLKR